MSEVFYGGAAFGGKSDWGLMGALEYADTPGYAALIVRRTYADLDQPGAIMQRAKTWLGTSFWNEQKKTFTFPGTDPPALLKFGYLAKYDDVEQYQSAEFQYVFFDELTQFEEAQYTYLFSRIRRPALPCAVDGCEQPWPCPDHPGAAWQPDTPEWRVGLSKVPLRMRAASNPGGRGAGWVKRRFPIEQDGKDHGRRVFIPAKLTDNKHVDRVAYAKSLDNLDEVLREQLLNGDWGIWEGMAYPELDEAIHAVMLPPADLTSHWTRHESMDHGTDNPTAWLLYLTDYDGNVIVADEYYAPGLVPAHAAEILDRRRQWWSQRDDDGWPISHPCYGDPSITASHGHQDELGDPLTIKSAYAAWKIGITGANNRRPAGYVKVRSMIDPSCRCVEEPLGRDERCPACGKLERRRFPLWHPRAGRFGSPRLFVVRDRCPNLWQQLVDAPIEAGENKPDRGEAVEAKWEGQWGHCSAALRYGLLGPSRSSEEPETLPDDPRAAAIVVRQRRRAEDWKRKQRGGAGQAAAADW